MANTKKLRALNDLCNAVSNTSRRVVRGCDDTLYLLNVEGGDTRDGLNGTTEMLADFMEEEAGDKGEAVETLPDIMSDKFRKDMFLDLFDGINPVNNSRSMRDPGELMAKSLVPGLTSLKENLVSIMMKYGVEDLPISKLDNFFDNRVCEDPKCLKALYKGTENHLLPVQHDPWFYYPEEYNDEREYLSRAVNYILAFEREPVSTSCALCAQYHRTCSQSYLTDDLSATLTLLGTPDEFKLNNKIWGLYSLHGQPTSVGFQFQGLAFKKITHRGAERLLVIYQDQLYY